MKLEAPPHVEFDQAVWQRIWKGEFDAFLSRSDQDYWYWDELKYKKDVPFSTPKKNWQVLKGYRRAKYEKIELGGNRFHYYVSPFITQELHAFDKSWLLGDPARPLAAAERSAEVKSLLVEEAVASSQIEGAATTTAIARELLASGRKPRNESEQMIVNNLRAIEFIASVLDQDINHQLVCELHQIMTSQTKAGESAGSFRQEQVYVTDHVDGEIAHIPPHARQVAAFMDDVYAFVNSNTPFIHPIVKASILHFLIGFIHPFADGNGRTARALFYWYLWKNGYTLIKNISISRVILESRVQYDKAFLKTEMDEFDLNYFIAYSVKTIRLAFNKFHHDQHQVEEECKQLYALSYALLMKGLNKRQADLVSMLYVQPEATIHLTTYGQKHSIVRQTASKDLQALIKHGLLIEDKSSKPYRFVLCSTQQVDRFLK